MKHITTYLTLIFLLIASVSSAHPGHGTSNGIDILHYLTSPLHVILLVAVVAGVFYVKYRQSSKQKN
jgi:heme/copper-type cytochrome/quinol oxidase subunit 2